MRKKEIINNARGCVYLLACFTLMTSNAIADSRFERGFKSSKKYWQIHSVEVEKVQEELRELPGVGPRPIIGIPGQGPNPTIPPRPIPGRPTPGRPFPGRPFPTRPSNVIDKFILVGEKVWQIIKDGRPVVNVEKMKTLDVLPFVEGESVNAFDLDSWSLPQVSSYKVSFKNGFGKKVVDIHYRIFFSYGGNYHGQGNYLTGITVEPKSINAKWGFTVNVETNVVSVTNVGTRDNPMPAMTFQLKYHVSSFMSDSENRETYTIVGNGKLIDYH